MSKTYSIQIEKAHTLLNGLRKNYEQITAYGVTVGQLNQLEQNAAEANQLNNELEALREQVSKKSSVANKKLQELRTAIQNLKQIVKKNFDQGKWEDLGVPDKR